MSVSQTILDLASLTPSSDFNTIGYVKKREAFHPMTATTKELFIHASMRESRFYLTSKRSLLYLTEFFIGLKKSFISHSMKYVTYHRTLNKNSDSTLS